MRKARLASLLRGKKNLSQVSPALSFESHPLFQTLPSLGAAASHCSLKSVLP